MSVRSRLVLGALLPGLAGAFGLAAILHYPPDPTGCAFDASLYPNLPAGQPDFSIDPPNNPSGGTVSVADYGASPGNPDNFAAFQNAIDAARVTHAATLTVPPGGYRFTTAQRLSFDNLHDLTFDGQGAELIFSTSAAFGDIEVENSTRLVLKNFTVDWDWTGHPLAYYGVVQDKTGSSITLNFPQVADIPQTISFYDVERVDSDFVPTQGGGEQFIPNITAVTKPSATTLTLTTDNAFLLALPVGAGIRMRQYTYECHAFILVNLQHFLFQQVHIFAAPGMGWAVLGETHHGEWNGCQVIPRPGSNRCISTAADGINSAQTLGFFKVLNCEFAFQGDDAMNIHDSSAIGFVPVDARTITLVDAPSWRNPFNVGDVVQLRNPDYSILGDTAALVSVSYNGSQCTLQFAADLPSPLNPNTVFINKRYTSGQIIVRNNNFHDNRARGILVRAPNQTLSGNTLSGMSGPAILFTIGPPEGTVADNIVVDGNTFDHPNAYRWNGGAAVAMDMTGLPDNDNVAPPNTNLLLSNNSFQNYQGAPINLRLARNAIVGGNTCQLGPVPKDTAMHWGAFNVERTANVSFCCNLWAGGFPAANQGEWVDGSTVTGFSGCMPTPTFTPTATPTGRTATPTRTPTAAWTPAITNTPTRTPTSNPLGRSFFTLTPCRVLDTRNPVGPLGGPALAGAATRNFVLIATCGIPSSAKAVSVNVTITGTTAAGDLRLFSGGAPLPLASTINYRPGQARANNAIVTLGESGDINARCDQASGTVQLIVDVNGYFE